MRVITIRQPWATLIALGEKKFETRSRRTHVRGPLAIHAGKQIDVEACNSEPIKSTLAKHGYTADNLPTGAIIATSHLSECYKINHTNSDGEYACHIDEERNILAMFEDNEYAFGFYSQGRYAWELSYIKRLVIPLKAKGQQGFWNYPVEQHYPI